MIPWLRLSLVVAAAALLAGCGKREKTAASAGESGLRPVRFQTDWLPQTEHGGYYQAREKGFYREAGLDVAIVPGGPGVGIREVVALGRADLGMTDGNDVLQAISRGLPLVIVGAEMQHNPQGILFHQEHALRGFEDLNGRTLMAGAVSAWVEYLRRRYQIQFDLQPVTSELALFLQDPRQARQCFVTDEPFFVEQKGARVGTLLIADSGYDPYRVIFTRREFAEKNPETVKAFVAASTRGWRDFMEGDPQPALAAVARLNPQMTPERMAFSRNALRERKLVAGDPARGERYGLITLERLKSQIAILNDLGLLARPLEPEETAELGFLPPEEAK